ncbi:hypothetical protein ACF06T_30650 [Streptomyces albidoflavus]
MSEPLTAERLAAIADRAAHAYEYDPSEQAEVLAGTDVPALLAEVERFRESVTYHQDRADRLSRQVSSVRRERGVAEVAARRLRLAWQSARKRAAGERQAAEWVRDEELERLRADLNAYFAHESDADQAEYEKRLAAYANEIRAQVLREAITAVEDPKQRRAAGAGAVSWESACGVLYRLLRAAE